MLKTYLYHHFPDELINIVEQYNTKKIIKNLEGFFEKSIYLTQYPKFVTSYKNNQSNQEELFISYKLQSKIDVFNLLETSRKRYYEGFNNPNGLCVQPLLNHLFVCDNENIKILDVVTGKLLRTISSYDGIKYYSGYNFKSAQGITFDENTGAIISSDSLNNKVIMMDSTGNPFRVICDEKCIDPKGIKTSNVNGNLYIANSCVDKITVWTIDGKFITQFGEFGVKYFGLPIDVVINVNDNDEEEIIVSDKYYERINVFISNGENSFASKLQIGHRNDISHSSDGAFSCISGLELSKSLQMLVVCDLNNNRLQFFR